MFAHPEKVPSPVERYQKEILPVFSVLHGVLANVGSSAASQLLRTSPSSLGTTPLCMSSSGPRRRRCGEAVPRFVHVSPSIVILICGHALIMGRTDGTRSPTSGRTSRRFLRARPSSCRANGILKPTREHVRHACTNAVEVNNADCGGARSKGEPLQNICNKCNVRPVRDVARLQ